MPDQLQLRGGTTAQHTSFTGASKEVTVDTTKKTAVVHDGSTVGGVPLLREDGSNSALALGSQGTPSLKWDANTGIYSPGEDQLAVATNGTGRLFVDSNGLVGIGATPTSKLEVSHSGSNVVNLTGPANASLVMTGASVGLVLRCGGEATFGATTNDPLALITNNTERLRITSAGLVGIGTSSPSSLLHIQSNLAGNNQIILTNIASSNSGAGSEIVFTQGASGHAAGKIQCDREGAYSATVSTHDSALAFFTAADGVDVERLRITSAGLVGIGTTSPSSLLHLNSNSTSASNGGLQIATADSNESFVTVGVSTSLDTAFISSLQNGSGSVRPISFVVGTSSTQERMRIDTSGRLLVGTSTAQGTNAFQVQQSAGGFISLRRDEAATAITDGEDLGAIEFQDNAGGVYARLLGEADGTAGASDYPGRLVFATTADGAASPTERMRITSDAYVRLASGTGGIQFNGDTAAANALDDYEEGTFTPTIVGTTTAGTGTYSIQVGVYTKIGNVVHYAITILWTAHTGTGNMRIDGLPFTARNLANYNPPVALDVNNLTSPADTIVTGTFLSNTTLIGFNSVPVAGGARAALAIDTAATIWLSGSCAI